MTVTRVERERPKASNPLETVENIAHSHDWLFDRMSEDELAIEVSGRWCDFRMQFSWRGDIQALHFTCAFDMRVPLGKRRDIHELLATMNERLAVGHFDVWSDEGLPMYRHTSLMRGVGRASVEQLEDLMDIAITECERFYPAFQFVIWGGKTAPDAIAASLLDTRGEA
jgi:hypothetical protein